MHGRAFYLLAKTSFQNAAANRGETIGRLLFFAIILLVFASVWEAALSKQELVSLSAKDLIWYLAMTEWIVLSVPMAHLDIEGDIRSGQLHYHLVRPFGYIWTKFAEGLGVISYRLLLNGVAGMGMAWLLSQRTFPETDGLLTAITLGGLSVVIAYFYAICVGLAAFWLLDATPIFWVWQKLTFVLGGLILPLSLYPEWLSNFASWTPFYWMIYQPASQVIQYDASASTACLAFLVLWGGIGAMSMVFLFHRGKQTINMGGG